MWNNLTVTKIVWDLSDFPRHGKNCCFNISVTNLKYWLPYKRFSSDPTGIQAVFYLVENSFTLIYISRLNTWCDFTVNMADFSWCSLHCKSILIAQKYFEKMYLMDDNVIYYVIYLLCNEGRPLVFVLVFGILIPAPFSGKLNI